MPIEIVAFWGFLILLLIFLGEVRPQFRLLAFLGCVLLIPLAFWINDSGVEVLTGTMSNTTTVSNTTLSGTTITGHESLTKTLTPLVIPYFNIRQIFFLTLVGLSVFGIVHYVQPIQMRRMRPTMNYARR
jgi:hypothetical protein